MCKFSDYIFLFRNKLIFYFIKSFWSVSTLNCAACPSPFNGIAGNAGYGYTIAGMPNAITNRCYYFNKNNGASQSCPSYRPTTLSNPRGFMIM